MPTLTRVIMSSVKKTFGNRKFYALPEDYALKSAKYRSSYLKKEETTKLIRYIDESVIGKQTTFAGPYGRRKVVYCDYTASGRSLQFIEDYILREVLPVYGNTHTTTSITSMQSTLLRHEARDIIRNSVHASEDDVVIFAGNGCTAAVHKLIHALCLLEPPVVFVGPCEHHSNLLPWRELQAKIVRISETKEGFLDLVDLENQLQLHRHLEGPERQLIGCFSAASNITGILADDIATTLLLHQYNALAFWDYATAAPYVQLDMNPILPGVNEKSVYKDAIFFSGHKFVGGVQTPGILVAKKKLFSNPVPETCGGGTVFFVTHNSHCYLKDTELREEGGTAGIVESIRMGLVMQLKQTVGVAAITAREDKITKMVLSHMRNTPEIILLGNSTHGVKRLAVVSFLVRHPRGTYLHHNFICAVLNDVFGVQVRGGCACAGPYAQDLLGIDQDLAQEYEDILMEDSRLDRRHLRRREEHSSYEMLRPGFSRLSLPYFMPDSEVAYVLEAIKMVATEGWKLLPQYILNPETGEWRHHTNSVYKERKWLGSIRYTDGKMSVNERRISSVAVCPADHNDCLQTARNIFNKARKMAQRYPLTDQSVMFDERAARLRWFMLPSEAQDLLLGNSQNVKQTVPFTPADYCGSRGGVSPPLCPSTPPTPGLTPFARHNSLSALDIKARRTQERSDSQSSSPVPGLAARGSMPQLPISLGSSRERCYSLDSNKIAATPPIPISNHHPCIRQRQISCGSQTDLSQNGNDSSVTGDGSDSRGATPPNSISENAEQIQAYVEGVTKELATEIKSEIREVINKVEDVLSENNDSLETNVSLTDKRYSIDFQLHQQYQLNQQLQALQHYSIYSSPPANYYQTFQPQQVQTFTHLPNQVTYQPLSLSPVSSFNTIQSQQPQSLSPMPSVNSTDSVSANHVAEYLAELTSEVVSEVKSEFREMVSAVDELISPNNELTKQLSNESNPDLYDKNSKCCFLKRNSIAESNNIHNINAINNNDGLKVIAENKVEEGSAYCNHLVKDKRRSTLNSISSQDSGINLTYHDRDSSASPSDCSMKNSADSGRCRQFLSPVDKAQYQNSSADDTDGSNTSEGISLKVCKKARWHCPPKNVWKPATEAIKEFNMLHDGDRVMVCLSGGKDSLSLLHTLRQYQFYARSKGIHFKLGAATVDPGSAAYDPRPLIPYLKELGVHYLYEEQQILDQASKAECKSICSFCSRMKRGRLYAAARQHDYNVLALGQHLDDLAESFLMSTFHNGRLRSMKAHYVIKEKDLRVIRPFVYVREKSLRQFAESRDLPIIPENCPACFEAPKERHRTKQLLAQQEILFPRLFLSLRSALKPLISFNKTGEESRAYNHAALGPFYTDDDSETEEEPVSMKSDKSNNSC